MVGMRLMDESDMAAASNRPTFAAINSSASGEARLIPKRQGNFGCGACG